MRQKSSMDSVGEALHRREILHLANRVFLLVLPLLVLAVLGDLARWAVALRNPRETITPSLEEFRKQTPTISTLELPATLFLPTKQGPAPAAATASETSPQVALHEVEWKLRGVILSGNKRAFLEDPQAKESVWVSEGEKLGAARVEEIRERSVILKIQDKSYEIRM